jgi:hypothetical protein
MECREHNRDGDGDGDDYCMMMMMMTKHNDCNADDNGFSNIGYILSRDMSEMTVAARVITQRQ